MYFKYEEKPYKGNEKFKTKQKFLSNKFVFNTPTWWTFMVEVSLPQS